MNETVPAKSPFQSVQQSHLLRLIVIGVLVLSLQIPVLLIKNVVRERQARRNEAAQEITSKWGNAQTIVGPMLVVPYIKHFVETDRDGKEKTRAEWRFATFLPGRMEADAKLDCAIRYRGIFQIPVYSLRLHAAGQFTRPDFTEWGIDQQDVVWDQAHLTLRIADTRAITESVALRWNDAELPFLPGAGTFGGGHRGIHAPMRGRLNGDVFAYAFQLNLNGSSDLYFAPLGEQTEVTAEADWANPSFQGNWLPSQRDISANGFRAAWNIPFLGRNYPQQWLSEANIDSSISGALFGVKFISPVDEYRMSERSTKYAIMFLALTFAAIWLFEVIYRRKVHFIQYLFVGFAMCLFYLLELALSEHLGFDAAYAIATAAITMLIGFYSAYALRGRNRAAAVSVMMLLLYGYLYIMLVNQDYALLIGSVLLFLILAAVMFVTRKIDWYSMDKLDV